MNKNKNIFSKLIPITLVCGSLFLICDFADAATRASARPTPTTRKNTTTTNTIKNNNTTATVTATSPVTTQDIAQKTENPKEPETVAAVVAEDSVVPEIESETFFEEYEQKAPEIIISNKSNQFEDVIDAVMESAGEDNSFAEQIRRQRAALAASEASTSTSNAQRNALATNSHVCDVALRKCMMEICDKDFTKCATDGDTDFGDKLNKCRNGTECSTEEFSLFAKEIKSDRDMNVRLASYNAVIDCGNNYNACIVNECGTTYSKCLGKSGADAAIQKCSVIARECSESDSGLATRFGTAIGKLRENAEKDVKTDENRLYTLRELMRKSCQSMGAAFDERSFDCVYSIEFYAGSDQSTPMASRKAYAGDSFVCTQEWFGINTTTVKENAYRETRSQTAASSAMLGSGVGMAAGLISSGAINRAIDTQNAKKDYKEECKAQGGTFKNGKCSVDYDEDVPSNAKPITPKPVTNDDTSPNNTLNNDDENDLNQQDVSKNGISATAKNHFYIKYNGDTKTTVQTECQSRKNDSTGWLKDTSLQKCNDLNINNWKVDFYYGSVFGEARCAINKVVLYNTGTPNNQEGQGCWCHGVKYISTKKDIKSTYISKLPWLYVAELGKTPKECEMMCTRYCADEVLKIPHVRKTIFGIK